MKTDLVLTTDEFLDQCCVIPKHVSPPGRDARHISVTAADELDLGAEVHGCQCDRWGHPCLGCLKSRPGSEHETTILAERK